MSEIAAPPPASRWAVVTGSSSGIGRACALRLARAGWNLVVHGQQATDRAAAVADLIRQHGRQAVVEPADLADREQVSRFVDLVWQATAGVAAWVHVAGADTLTGPESAASFEQKLERLTFIDLWGTMLACRQAGQRMRAAGGGAIVTIGWDQAATGMEGDSGELFGAIKGGIASFTRSLAKSLAPSVRVNCVAPGWIKTSWGEQAAACWQERVRRETPLGRWGAPEDVADCVAFLVSDAARFVTGQTFNVNGGAVSS